MNRTIQIIAAVLTLACIIGSSLITNEVQEVREEESIGSSHDVSADLPPDMALLSAATGPLRGLAVDLMWYRLEDLKQKGKFHEANQLSVWITKMQPRFPKVWAFMAWNMAYNISVKTLTPRERWDWINKGIAILREEGIPHNPKAIGLYRELSWIFFHKVGQYTDDMHWSYKRELAREWQEVLGAPLRILDEPEDPNKPKTPDQIREERQRQEKKQIDRFRRIPESPDTWAELVEKHPRVATLWNGLFAQLPAGYKPDETFLRETNKVFMYNYAPDMMAGVKLGQPGLDKSKYFDVKLLAAINTFNDDPQTIEDFKTLIAFLRKRVIIDRYHMDPAFMLDLMEKIEGDDNDVGYGFLDFRHPAAHGVYWGALGVKQAIKITNSQDNVDYVNTDRQVIHSLQQLRDTGRIVFDPFSGRIDMLPDLRFIESYGDAKFHAVNRVAKLHDLPPPTKSSFDAGHENFLNLAVAYEYMYGDKAMAEHYRREARQKYGSAKRDLNNPNSYKYDIPLEELVYKWWTENGYFSTGRGFIDGAITQAFIRGLAAGRPDIYNKMIGVAHAVHKRLDQDAAEDGRVDQARQKLPPFPTMVASSAYNILTDGRYPVVQRHRIWISMQPTMQRFLYPRIIQQLRAEAKARRFDVDKVIPRPEGASEVPIDPTEGQPKQGD